MIPGAGPEWVPYCGTAPLPGELLARWNFDPALLAIIALLSAALLRQADRRVPAIAAGLLAFALFVTPFCALSSALFSARVVHHVLLAGVLAPLLVGAISLRLLRVPGSLPVWTALQALAFWWWHAPPAYSAALSSDVIYWAMQVSLLVSAAGFWNALLRSTPVAAIASLLATTVQMGLLGALITFADVPLYAPHLLTTRPWGLSPLEDQQLAGLIMWAPAAALYLAAALLVAGRWLEREERELAA